MANDSRAKTIVFRGNAPSPQTARLESLRGAARRIFLLSPANPAGMRGRMLLRSKSESDLVDRLRSGNVSLGEVFTFMSSLYFRGKLTYAQTFAYPPAGLPGAFILVPSRGLLLPETKVNLHDLQELSAMAMDLDDDRYVAPLQRDAHRLKETLGPDTEIVLLGSIATQKYVGPLLEIFGPRLVFPATFVGRGNMSRGGLLLRCVRENMQLDYVPVATAMRTGSRPAKLDPLGGSRQKRKQ